MYSVEALIPLERAILGAMLGYAQIYPQSIFSTLFIVGEKRYGVWLPMYCSNLLVDATDVK